MIAPNELRIGNWFRFPFIGYAKLRNGIDIDAFVEAAGDPIPLTDEWLERCVLPDGLFKDALYKNQWRDGSGNFDGWCIGLKYSKGDVYKPVSIRIHYVHQLQNTFYWITGTELEIKLP